MFVTEKFGMACCTVYHLRKRAKSTHELGIINSPEFNLGKKTPEEGLCIQLSLCGKVSSTCLQERDAPSKNWLSCWVCQ